MVGALDGLSAGDIPSASGSGYPLETRLTDGTRVVVDADFVAARMEDGIGAEGDEVTLHLILCAGPFPNLAPPAPERGVGTAPIVVPFRCRRGPSSRNVA